MQRRRLLATLAAGVSLPGCTALTDDPGAGTPDGRPTDEPTDSPTEAPDDGRDPDALAEALLAEPTVVAFDTAPLSASLYGNRIRTAEGIEMVIDLVDPATAEAPARAVCVVTNGTGYERTLRTRRLPGFGNPATGRTDDHATVYLAPAAGNELAARTPSFERDADGRWRLGTVGEDWYPETVTLAPESSAIGEFHLLGHHMADEPPVGPGTYRFSWRDNGFRVAVWRTDAPGPERDSRFGDVDVPDLPGEGPTAWSHEADAATPVVLDPSAEAVAAPARIDFELVNRSSEALGGNPYMWRLRKLVDGEWFHVEPWLWPEPYATVPPGATDESSLHLFHGDPVPCEGAREAGFLGGGRYAYTVGFSRGDETHAALFDLEAPPLRMPPEDGLDAEREADGDGDRVVVESPRYAEARTPATFTVRRVADADDRVIPEQLSGRPYRALRNTLPFFEPDVETVRLLTDRGTALRLVDYEDGAATRFAFEGDAFEAVGETE